MTACGCKYALHVHGHYLMYDKHRCRCVPCRVAKSRLKARAYQLANLRKPKIQYVELDLARARVRRLQKAGLTIQDISRISGVHPKTIEQFVSTTWKLKRTKVQRSVYDALMSVSSKTIQAYQPPLGARVDATVSRQQIQALHCLGWCPESIFDRTGVLMGLLYRALKADLIVERNRITIETVYLQLRDVRPPEVTIIDARRVQRAKERASENSWSTEAAEDWFEARAA